MLVKLLVGWLRARRAWLIVLVLLWLSLFTHGMGSEAGVRLRNALEFKEGPATDFMWQPESAPASYLRETAPPMPYFVALAKKLNIVDLSDDWAAAVRISAHLLTSAPALHGGALKRDIVETHQAITQLGDGYCADFVRVFQGIAGAAGLPFRTWSFSFDGYGGHGHIVVEIWNRQRARWELLDLFNNVYFVGADGLPMDALALREALKADPTRLQVVPLVATARPGYDEPDKLLGYYQRGLNEWYLRWGENRFAYEAASVVRWLGTDLRGFAQFMMLMSGERPAVYALAEPGNARQRAAMHGLRWHAIAVALGSLVVFVGLFWPRRSRRPV